MVWAITLLGGVDRTVRRHVRVSLLVALVAVFLVLNLADAALTWRGLSLGAVELNPLMQALGGTVPFLAVKVVVGFAVVLVSLHRAGKSATLYWEYVVSYCGVLALYGWVVWHNAGVVMRRMG